MSQTARVHLVATIPDTVATALAYSADGARWAAAGAGQLTWFAQNKVVHTLRSTSAPVGALQLSRDGQHATWGAFSFALDGQGRQEHDDAIAHRLVTTALGGAPAIEITDAASTGTALVIAAHTRPASSARVAATQRAVVLRIEHETAQPLWDGPIVGAPARVAVDGARVVFAGNNVTLIEGGKTRFDKPNPHVGSINALALAGDKLFTAGADGSVAMLSATGDVAWKVAVASDPLRALVVDEGVVIVTGWDDQLHWLSAADGKPLGTLVLGAHAEALCVSPDHAQLLVGLGGPKPEVRVYSWGH